MFRPYPKHIILLSCVLGLLGCLKLPPPPLTSLSTAEKKLIELCKKEFNYEIIVKPVGRTVWVYVPLSGGILELKAAPKQPPSLPKKSWSILFLESIYNDKTFIIDYDIDKTKKYGKDYGYGNHYSDEYTKTQGNLITAVTHSYFDVGTVPGDIAYTDGEKDEKHRRLVEAHIKPDEPPEFFVIVYADIKKGIAARTISDFNDMKKALSNPPVIPQEEYAKRYIFEIYGDEALIGDKSGLSLTPEEIHLADFLAQQIQNRINYQFLQSSFPPSDDVEKEILKIVNETTRLYNFDDFTFIKLHDLKNEKEYLFNKSQLETFAQ